MVGLKNNPPVMAVEKSRMRSVLLAIADEHVVEHSLGDGRGAGITDVVRAEFALADLTERHVVPMIFSSLPSSSSMTLEGVSSFAGLTASGIS